MRKKKSTLVGRVILWLAALMLLIGLSVGAVLADEALTEKEKGLVPDDLVYEDGNIILHKQAERIGPEEWLINVKVKVGDQEIQKRKLEVVFLLDVSSSMRSNTAHDHTSDCSTLTCTKHIHDDSCYTLTCTEAIHTHTFSNGSNSDCYSNTQCTKHSRTSQHQAAGCVSTGTGNNRKWYELTCTNTHTEHSMENGCYSFTCEKVEESSHTHGLGCYECPYYGSKPTSNDDEYLHNGDATRMAVAVVAAERLIASLPADTTVVRLAFSGQNDFRDGISSYYDVNTSSGTYMWTAINKTLTGNYFNYDEASKKIFVVLTDGSASDSASTTISNNLQKFKDDGGTVFAVGFDYNSTALNTIAGGENGKVYLASNAGALTEAFEDMAQTLTAMLEDPMGSSVGFTPDSIVEIKVTNGEVTNPDGDTIYWHPSDDGGDVVSNSEIWYSYTVDLNTEANRDVGEHTDVPLNNPTYFKYGMKRGENEPEVMNSAAFPIPEAYYTYSSLQTWWKADNGTDVLPPTDFEKIISDYMSTEYIPTFTQDYANAPVIIPIEGSNDYYRYVTTSVTDNGEALTGLDDIKAYHEDGSAHDYQVVHKYEKVESYELYITGSKTLVGRDFKEGDQFTFILTAGNATTPMPDPNLNDGQLKGGTATITIEPDAGNKWNFEFLKIIYQEAGVYNYTLQEQIPTDTGNIIYDPTVYNIEVTVTEVPVTGGTELVATYKVDGVSNAPMNFVNSLETGSLKIEKTAVISYLDQHQETVFPFRVQAANASGRAITGDYVLVKNDGTTATVTFNAGVAFIYLKAGELAVIQGLPDGTTYTVTEEKVGGFTATATGDKGTIVAERQSIAAFTNTYAASGSYKFIGNKSLEGGTLRPQQFTFSIKDENGNVVASGKNTSVGTIYFDEIFLTHEDIGVKELYTIIEVEGSDPNYIYDSTVYNVTLTITDNGDGTLSIVSNLANEDLIFTNVYVTNTLRVSKVVDGNMGNKNKEFDFTLTVPAQAGETVNISTDGGQTFTEVTLNEQGKAEFTLKHGDNVIFYPITGTYTVTEVDNGSYTTTYSHNNGGEIAGTSVSGTIPEEGNHTVRFTNTYNFSIPTGVHDSTAAALAGIVMAMAMLAIVYIGRRWKVLEK